MQKDVQENNFLQFLVSKLGTCFAVPEEEIIKQDEQIAVDVDMYFISKGDCAVNIKDEKG